MAMGFMQKSLNVYSRFTVLLIIDHLKSINHLKDMDSRFRALVEQLSKLVGMDVREYLKLIYYSLGIRAVTSIFDFFIAPLVCT